MQVSLFLVFSTLWLLASARPGAFASLDPHSTRDSEHSPLDSSPRSKTSGNDVSVLNLGSTGGRRSAHDGERASLDRRSSDERLWVHTNKPNVQLADCDIPNSCDPITLPNPNTAIHALCQFTGRYGLFYKNGADGRYFARKDINPPESTGFLDTTPSHFDQLRPCTVEIEYRTDRPDIIYGTSDEYGAPGDCLPGDTSLKETDRPTVYVGLEGWDNGTTTFCKMYFDRHCNEEIPDLRLGGHGDRRVWGREIPKELGKRVLGYRCW